MDVFSWSIPFVSEKVNEMLYYLLKHTDQDADNEDSDNEQMDKEFNKHLDEYMKIRQIKSKDSISVKKDALRKKIAFLGKMIKIQKALRENNENIVKLKSLNPDAKIPRGVLL